MADKHKIGCGESDKAMIAAGEVGQFVFCPESWRLSRLQGYTDGCDEKAALGRVEHDAWSGTVEQLEAIRSGVRVLFLLCIAACLIAEWGMIR
jgi:hypothetical protein